MSFTHLELNWSTVLTVLLMSFTDVLSKEKRLLFILRADVFEENEDAG